MPSIDSRRLLHAVPRRSNPFWLVALRYSLFPIKSIMWVIFILTGRRLELSGPAVPKIFGRVGSATVALRVAEAGAGRVLSAHGGQRPQLAAGSNKTAARAFT